MIGRLDQNPTDDDAAWYAVHIRNQHETKVELGLRARGIEVFVPRITVRSRRKDKFKLLHLPLFSCYLFICVKMSSQIYNAIIRQSGVVGIVGGKGHCMPVPTETVTSIRSIMESGKTVYHWPRLVSGERVRVVNGSLSGTKGTLCHKSGKCFLVAGVELLKQFIAVELDEEIELAS